MKNLSDKKLWAALRRALYERVTEIELKPGGSVTAWTSTGGIAAMFPPRFVQRAQEDFVTRDAERIDAAGLNAALRSVINERLRDGMAIVKEKRAEEARNKNLYRQVRAHSLFTVERRRLEKPERLTGFCGNV